MTPKPQSQRNRESANKKRASGLRDIRVWVPDTQPAKDRVRAVAKAECDAHLKRTPPDPA